MDAGSPSLRPAVEQSKVDARRIEADPGDQFARLIEIESQFGLAYLADVVLKTKSVESEQRLVAATDEQTNVRQTSLEKLPELQDSLRRHELEVVDHESYPTRQLAVVDQQ